MWRQRSEVDDSADYVVFILQNTTILSSPHPHVWRLCQTRADVRRHLNYRVKTKKTVERMRPGGEGIAHRSLEESGDAKIDK